MGVTAGDGVGLGSDEPAGEGGGWSSGGSPLAGRFWSRGWDWVREGAMAMPWVKLSFANFGQRRGLTMRGSEVELSSAGELVVVAMCGIDEGESELELP